ncbi:MAG: adenine nucleotide alpha hydrolase family protein [Desulfovibrio sp.]|jgi:uncharacterized protein (TIGR00269 family)|nr:adenine nucleotide alpha hydrolase family protein [Desulfovibrio sp.]
MKCKVCKDVAVVALQSHNAAFCAACYGKFFSRQVARGIASHKLFTKEERVLVALSGGKDSLGIMLELKNQGYNVTGLHVDLGIPVSSAAARGVTERFCAKHGLPLIVREMEKEGLPIPEVKRLLPTRPVCSVCGKIKRYYFNLTALEQGFDALATGHNLDDETARLFSNTLRWDTEYLADQGPLLPAEGGFVKKVKPLWRLTEFETANFAYLMGIDNWYAPCPYSQGATFSDLKGLLHRLERRMPGRKLAFYQGFLERGKQAFLGKTRKAETVHPCTRCGYPTSSEGLCGVCRIRDAIEAKRGSGA